MNDQEVLLNQRQFFKEINELKIIYGKRNIIVSPKRDIILIKNFKLPGGYLVNKTKVAICIPDCYGYGVPVLDIFIAGLKGFPHLFSVDNDIYFGKSIKIDNIKNFIKKQLTKKEKLKSFFIKLFSFGKLRFSLYWVCLHTVKMEPCTLLEQLSILYLALGKISRDEKYREQLNNMRTNYQRALSINRQRIKQIKAEMIYRFPFPEGVGFWV